MESANKDQVVIFDDKGNLQTIMELEKGKTPVLHQAIRSGQDAAALAYTASVIEQKESVEEKPRKRKRKKNRPVEEEEVEATRVGPPDKQVLFIAGEYEITLSYHKVIRAVNSHGKELIVLVYDRRFTPDGFQKPPVSKKPIELVWQGERVNVASIDLCFTVDDYDIAVLPVVRVADG